MADKPDYHQEFLGQWVETTTNWKKLDEGDNRREWDEVRSSRYNNDLRELLETHARYVTRIYEKGEESCGHCPLSLTCMQTRPFNWDYNTPFYFTVCPTCFCLGFVHAEEMGFHLCSLIRKGFYSRDAIKGQYGMYDRLPGKMDARAYVNSALGMAWNQEHRRPVRSFMPIGCGHATMEDVFPVGFDGDETKTPFDCTTDKLIRRAVQPYRIERF